MDPHFDQGAAGEAQMTFKAANQHAVLAFDAVSNCSARVEDHSQDAQLQLHNMQAQMAQAPAPPAGGTTNETPDSSRELELALVCHPAYPQVITAWFNCRKVGADKATTDALEAQRVAALRQARWLAEQAAARLDGPPASDPGMDSFLHRYLRTLEGFRHELGSTLAAAEKASRDFEASIAAVLEGCEGGGASEPGNSSGGSQAASEGQSLISLKRRYAERIVALHEEHRNKKKAGKLPTEAVAVLKAWWDANQANPYPSEEIKKQMISATGLDATQINNWLINQRKRHWDKKPGKVQQAAASLAGTMLATASRRSSEASGDSQGRRRPMKTSRGNLSD